MKPAYILQNDLPDVKAGAEFTIGDALDVYFLSSDKTVTKHNCYTYPKKFVENNPVWFRLKEEEQKPEVIGIEKRENVFLCHIHFSADNFKAIPINKERLAEVLIAENEGHFYIDDEFLWYREDNEIIKDKKYSEQEYLEFGEGCFNAARKNNSEWYYRYKNFSDYMNSQKPKE